MGAAAVPIGLGALSLFGQAKAASDQRKAQAPQRSIAQNQKQLFQQTLPWYNPILQALAGNAGLTLPGGAGAGGVPGGLAKSAAPGAASGAPPALPMGSTAMGQGALGIFGSNPADRYRFAQAEEELGDLRRRRNAELMMNLTQQGAGSATLASALARNEGDYQQGLAGARRDLAINAQDEAQKRLLTLLSALSPGMGLGQSAAGIFGDQAALAAGRQNAMGQAAGGALEAYLQYQALKRQRSGGLLR